MTLKSSLTDSQLVDEWSGTAAQLRCNLSFHDVLLTEGVPTLTDVNMAFSNATSVRIITIHLQSVLQFSGVELSDSQLAETALAILANYWFLNLAELCIFFSQLKAGNRGQFVWGSKINNQAIMVALNDFCRDRRYEIEKIETEKMRDKKELYHSRIESTAASIVTGLDMIRNVQVEAKYDITAFRKLYPYLPDTHEPEIWWNAWKGDPDSLKQVYGDNVPPIKIAMEDVGKYLCEFTIRKAKTNG